MKYSTETNRLVR